MYGVFGLVYFFHNGGSYRGIESDIWRATICSVIYGLSMVLYFVHYNSSELTLRGIRFNKLRLDA